jgi:lipid-A-disaccharide synthase-like uncharacterized protein
MKRLLGLFLREVLVGCVGCSVFSGGWEVQTSWLESRHCWRGLVSLLFCFERLVVICYVCSDESKK